MHTLADRPATPETAIMLRVAGDTANAAAPHALRTQAESEERSLRMARAIAELLRDDPTLLRRAAHYTGLLFHEGQGTADSDLAEWRQLLESYSTERLRDLLLGSSSRAIRLRRSMPFLSVLSADERDRVMKFMETTR